MFSLLVAAAAAGSLELGARLLVRDATAPLVAEPLAGSAADRAPEVFRSDPEVFWSPRPNLRLLPPVAWGDVTNSRGLRGTDEYSVDAPRTTLRVACVGDSCTYGLGLPAGEAWPAQLGAFSGFEVLNAGVPGYSSWQGRRWFEAACADLAPDVVVVQFGNNDCSPWPDRDGDGLRFVSDADRHRRMSVQRFVGRSRFLAWLLSPSRAGVAAPALAAAPFDLEAVPARVEVPDFERDLDALAPSAPTVVFLSWVRRAEFASLAGDPLLARHRPYREAVLARRRRGDAVVDAGDAFRRSGASAPELYLDDVHATPRGAAIVAEAVLAAIRRTVSPGSAGPKPVH